MYTKYCLSNAHYYFTATATAPHAPQPAPLQPYFKKVTKSHSQIKEVLNPPKLVLGFFNDFHINIRGKRLVRDPTQLYILQLAKLDFGGALF